MGQLNGNPIEILFAGARLSCSSVFQGRLEGALVKATKSKTSNAMGSRMFLFASQRNEVATAPP